jgi:hypothetical protein
MLGYFHAAPNKRIGQRLKMELHQSKFLRTQVRTAFLLTGICVAVTGCSSEASTPAANVGRSTGGVAAGGSTATGATTGGATTYWPAAYSMSGLPTPSNGYHTTPQSKCNMCHSASGVASGLSTSQFVFGGTVFQADGTTPAANVQVGVSDGTNKYFVYSATNGMYWAIGTATINWALTDIRTRNEKGEHKKLAATGRSADCDSCHIGAQLLKEP